MAYSHTTLADLQSALASRLQDPKLIHWSSAELRAYISEALQTFQAMTNFSRIRGSFSSTAGTAFYDLPTSLKAGLASPLSYNVKDIGLVETLSYHLYEKVPTGLGTLDALWVGTQMFSLGLFISSLQRRRNAFIAATGCTLTQAMQGVPSSPVSRVQLPDNVIAVRRAAWKDVSAIPYAPLWQEDAWAATAFSQAWSVNPGTPISFSVIEDQPLEIQMIPPPASSGQLDLVTVNSGTPLDESVGVVLGVADNWSWAVKWGALADLLAADGEAHDPDRSRYCEARYQEAVEMCLTSEVILHAELQGKPIFVSSLADFDAFTPQWQEVAGPPTGIASAGLNLVALGPVPDAGGPYSVVLDVVQNFPVPVTGGDMIQVGREDLEAILGLAQHISLFKEGAASVQDSLSLYQNFERHCAEFNQRILAQSRFLPAVAGQSRREEASRPYREITV